MIAMLVCDMTGCSCSKKAVRSGDTIGPGDVVARVIMLANQGRYSEASPMVEFRKVASLDVSFNDGEMGGWSEERKLSYWDDLTLRKSIAKIQILDEKLRDDFSVVRVKLIDTSGGERLNSFDLEKKTKGGWIMIIYYKMLSQQ